MELVCLIEEWKATVKDTFIKELEETVVVDWRNFTVAERQFVAGLWKRKAGPLCYSLKAAGDCVDPREEAA